MPIRAVLFDLWGTLVHDDPEVSERRNRLRVEMARAALAEAGIEHDVWTIEKAFTDAATQHSRIHDEGRDLSAEGRTVLYVRALDAALLDRLDEAAWARMHQAILTPALSHRPALAPCASEVLESVKARGLATALVSNAGTTPGFVLARILDDHGVLQQLDAAVFSDEVEVAKPATAIFERALDEIGVEPADAVFVGDQPVLDVLGGQSAGMRVVQVGALRSDGITPDARIDSLGELMTAIDRLAAGV